MKEKIYQYLKAKGQYVTAEELLEQFFHVFNAHCLIAIRDLSKMRRGNGA